MNNIGCIDAAHFREALWICVVYRISEYEYLGVGLTQQKSTKFYQ